MLTRSEFWSYTAATLIALHRLANTVNALEGDLAHGEKLYAQCSGCHGLTENKLGPKHCGVLDQPAASVADFNYSPALRDSGIVWDTKHLHEFLKSPFTYVRGTKKGFVGLHRE